MIKQSVVGALIVWFASGIVHSQVTEFQPEWSFGVNAGATLSRVAFLPRIPQALLVQSAGGLTVRYISEKHWGLQWELNYSQRGWKEEPDGVTHFNDYSRRTEYIEMPFMTHLYWDLGKRARLLFNAGPQIGYNIGEKELHKKINSSSEQEIPRYYDNNYTVRNKFDYGITGGMGIEIRTGIGSFLLEGRYYYGLSDIFDNGKNEYFQSSHNQVIGIKLGYLIRR